MKKIITLLLIVVLPLSMFCSCNKDEERLGSLETLYFEDQEAWVNAIENAKQNQKNDLDLTDEELLLVDLETLPYPTAEISGYYLDRIRVMEYVIFYEYFPVAEKTEEKDVGKKWENMIQYSFNREKGVDVVDGFAVVAEQMRSQNGLYPTEDNVIYNDVEGEITFRVGMSYGCICVPQSMNNYETILSLCTYDLIDFSE